MITEGTSGKGCTGNIRTGLYREQGLYMEHQDRAVQGTWVVQGRSGRDCTGNIRKGLYREHQDRAVREHKDRPKHSREGKIGKSTSEPG